MPKHHRESVLPFTPKQLFDLVADIESYPEFLPWCEGARILDKKEDRVKADLLIGFKHINGTYTSDVCIDRDTLTITVKLDKGMFKHLHQSWVFVQDEKGANVIFDINFAMESSFMEMMVDQVFDKACDKMMDAFQARAILLYSSP